VSNHPVDQFLTAVDAGRLELSTGRITADTVMRRSSAGGVAGGDGGDGVVGQ
jgi:hypothetical protein